MATRLLAYFFAAMCLAIAAQATSKAEETIVLAGGCFWGVEAVYEHVKGVKDAVSGYAGGTADTAHYDQVSSGATGHAEAVKITYDPSVVSFDQLLDVYFKAAHNPTQLNYQGPDHGTQYRSAIFYATPQQKTTAESKVAAIQKDSPKPIMTTLEPLKEFYPAESYHQNFAKAHPTNPYIVIHDAPKVARLKKDFPALYEQE